MSLDGPIVLSIDPGVSDRVTSAHSVVQAWCLASDRYLLIDQFRGQVGFAILRDQVRHFRKRYRPIAILIERAANGHALISEFTRQYPGLIKAVDPAGRSKVARLLTHASCIGSRRVWLPASAPWRDEFVREFCEFPQSEFSDQVDATTQLLEHAEEFRGMPFSAGQRAAAAVASGRAVSLAPFQGQKPGIAVGTRYGRPIAPGSQHGPIMSIKAEVKY